MKIKAVLVVVALSCALLALLLPVTWLASSALAETSETASLLADPVVNVAHLAPFAENFPGTSVSIQVDTFEVITGLTYGRIVPGLTLPPGPHLIEILPGGGPSVAMSTTVTLTVDTQYTIAAVGDGTNQELELMVLIDETEPVTGSAKLRLAHVAPVSGSLDDTRIDLCTDTNLITIPNVGYGELTDPYATLPPGDYNMKIAVAGTGCQTVILDLPPVRLTANGIVDIFMVGGVGIFPFDLRSTTGVILLPPKLIFLPLVNASE